MWAPHLVVVAFALLSLGCRADAMGPPQIVEDRTACSHCRMFVSEPTLAAAYQATGQGPRVFDDIGCLLEAARREPVLPDTVWFQDAAGGGWLNADQALFVASPRIRTPMNGGVLAYANAQAAERSAAAHGGEVVRSFHELINRKGDAR